MFLRTIHLISEFWCTRTPLSVLTMQLALIKIFSMRKINQGHTDFQNLWCLQHFLYCLLFVGFYLFIYYYAFSSYYAILFIEVQVTVISPVGCEEFTGLEKRLFSRGWAHALTPVFLKTGGAHVKSLWEYLVGSTFPTARYKGSLWKPLPVNIWTNCAYIAQGLPGCNLKYWGKHLMSLQHYSQVFWKAIEVTGSWGLKKAYLTPIIKKGKEEDPRNSRPICLTLILGKVMEQTLPWTINISEVIQVIGSCPHGFAKGTSYLTSLLQWDNLLGKWRRSSRCLSWL